MLFVGTSIIHPSTEGVFLLCNILDLLIYSKLLTIVNLLYKFPIIFFFCNDSEPCEMEEKSRIMFT